MEVGEGVLDCRGERDPIGVEWCAGGGGPGLLPFVAWNLAHAAEQPLRRAAAEEDCVVGAPRYEGGAVAGGARFLRGFDRELSLPALPAGKARLEPGAERAGGFFGCADRGAEVHQRLSEFASPVLRHQ